MDASTVDISKYISIFYHLLTYFVLNGIISKKYGGNLMEKIYLIKKGELGEINKLLENGGKVKMIQPVSESISAYGYSASNSKLSYNENTEKQGNYIGNFFAYIVIETD